ncbi:hypothetical protein Syun_009737 [Stephania yunnanensis]|uniref:valine--tRNA ligase n=1 Tax=Stephania yunnanensis TaxID=152371 RepID=A0AAP0KGQ2_9MAGN
MAKRSSLERKIYCVSAICNVYCAKVQRSSHAQGQGHGHGPFGSGFQRICIGVWTARRRRRSCDSSSGGGGAARNGERRTSQHGADHRRGKRPRQSPSHRDGSIRSAPVRGRAVAARLDLLQSSVFQCPLSRRSLSVSDRSSLMMTMMVMIVSLFFDLFVLVDFCYRVLILLKIWENCGSLDSESVGSTLGCQFFGVFNLFVQDLNLSTERLASNKAFVNKLWNAGKFILQNLPSRDNVSAWENILAYKFDTEESLLRLPLPECWVVSKLHELIDVVTSSYERFFFGDIGRETYDFFWGDFADWHIIPRPI